MAGSFITDAVVVVLVLGLMIFVHELGHFLAAKFFGVRVLVFSLGFGKRLLHLTRGDTDYRISALPFGGYVKMAGDDPS
ncbi:MAG: site-2 protease family protein, partial [Terriglobia bacterium]